MGILDQLFSDGSYRTELPGVRGMDVRTPMSVRGLNAAGDFIPGYGDVKAIGEAGQALTEGDLIAAGLLGTGAAIGLIPGAGDAIARPIMAAGRAAGNVAADATAAFYDVKKGDLGSAVRAFAPSRPMQSLSANALRGGGMSDPTQTGWTFKDVKIPQFSPEQNRRIDDMFGRLQWREAELPIRSMYATQGRVNPDFATTTSSQDLVPTVVKYNNEYFVRDGHHRLTRAAEDGRQTANVAIIDLDGTDTSAPLLDYRALSLDEINAQKSEINSILDQLFGGMSNDDIEALANGRSLSPEATDPATQRGI